MAKRLPENDVKKESKDWLDLMGFFRYHNLQGLGSYSGTPDIVAVKNGQVLFIEAKAPHKKQSDGQLRFEKDLTEHGGTYILAYGYKDVEEVWNLIKQEEDNG